MCTIVQHECFSNLDVNAAQYWRSANIDKFTADTQHRSNPNTVCTIYQYVVRASVKSHVSSNVSWNYLGLAANGVWSPHSNFGTHCKVQIGMGSQLFPPRGEKFSHFRTTTWKLSGAFGTSKAGCVLTRSSLLSNTEPAWDFPALLRRVLALLGHCHLISVARDVQVFLEQCN